MQSRVDGYSSEDESGESLDNDKKSETKLSGTSSKGMFARPSRPFVGAVLDNGVHLRWNTAEEFIDDLKSNNFNHAKVVSKEQYEFEKPHDDDYEDRPRVGF